MRICVIVFLLMCTVMSSNQCQVTISPEIGLSYSPFKVTGNNPKAVISGSNESIRVDPLVGLSGTFPINEQWNVNMRFSYTWREDLKWQKPLQGIIPGLGTREFAHDNFNIDLSPNYELVSFIQIGIGASYARTINSWRSYKTIHPPDFSEFNRNHHHTIIESKYGMHSLIDVSLWYLNLKLEYTRFLYYSDGIDLANNRYSVILSIPLFSSAKRQR